MEEEGEGCASPLRHNSSKCSLHYFSESLPVASCKFQDKIILLKGVVMETQMEGARVLKSPSNCHPNVFYEQK